MRKLRLAGLVATIYFCVSGGPFGLEQVMQSGAGMGLLLIVVAPLIWGLPVALMTAELAGAMPGEGGYYIWVKEAMGPFGGFLCAWWTWVYSWVDVALYPTLFASYISTLIVQFGGHSAIDTNPWVKWMVGLVIIGPLTWLNIRGTRQVGDASIGFILLLLAPFVALVGLGLAHSVGHPPVGFVPAGQSAPQTFGAGLFIVMWNYLGWDSMSTVSGEVENPQRNFPLALAIGVPLVTLTYLLPAFVGVSYLRDLTKWDTGAWTLVGQAVGGPWLATSLAVAGLIGACGLFSATLLASSRIPLVLAADGYLPKPLARIHPRYQTPANAVLLSAAVYTALSFQTFKGLAALDVVMYSVGVLLELLALAILRARRPQMDRPYKIPGGWPVIGFIVLLPLALILFGMVSQYHDPEDGGVKFLVLSAIGILSGPVVYGCRRGLSRINAAR